MSERKFNVLIVDDNMYEYDPIFDLINDSLLSDQVVFYQCNLVEKIPARVEGLESITTAVQFLEELKATNGTLDFALLDRQFDEEFQLDIDSGPRRLIKLIQEYFPKCKILLLSKKGGLARYSYSDVKGIPNRRFRTIGKFEPPMTVKVIHDIVKEWVCDFLSDNISRIDVDEIAIKLKNGSKDLPSIRVNGEIWHSRTYLLPYYLYLQDPVDPDEASMAPEEILVILQKRFQPKLKAWHVETDNYRYPLAKYYERYKEWPARSPEKLNESADKFIREYMQAESNRVVPPVNRYNFKADIQSGIENFDFVPQFETILIGRRVAIGLFILGYSPKAIWLAFKKRPEVYSLLVEEEREKATPNQLFPTYYALSFKEDFPANIDSFDAYENLLMEEIEWLKQGFDMHMEDVEALNIYIADMKDLLIKETNNPLVTSKHKIVSYADADVILQNIILLLKQENKWLYFLETAKEDIAALNCSSNIKDYLTRVIDGSITS